MHLIFPRLFHWRSIPHSRRLAVTATVIAALFALGACTPALDWREVQAGAMPLKALLPCKPDAGDRVVTLDAHQVDMHLLGCKAAGALYVIGWVALDSPGRIGATLGAWQDSTLAHVGITPGPDAPAGSTFLPPGALALPQSRRIDAQGRVAENPDPAASTTAAIAPTKPLYLRAAWFGWAGRAGEPAYAVQAAIYADRPPQAEAVSTFFEALRPLAP